MGVILSLRWINELFKLLSMAHNVLRESRSLSIMLYDLLESIQGVRSTWPTCDGFYIFQIGEIYEFYV